MSHTCTTCNGSGRVTDELRGRVILRQREVRVVVDALNNVIETCEGDTIADESRLNEIQNLIERMFRPLKKDL